MNIEKKKKTLAMLAPLVTIGAISLSSLVVTTTPTYAIPSSSLFQEYCYSREHPSGERQLLFCAFGTGAQQLCEEQQAADPEALTPCHRMFCSPMSVPVLLHKDIDNNDCSPTPYRVPRTP
jgi:hypothetical protein